MSRVDDLRDDYDLLGSAMQAAEGSWLASLARERRVIGELLEALETPEEVTVVDELDAQRRARTGDSGSSSRRRKSG